MKPIKTYATRKQAAYDAGVAAFREGKPLSACPILKHQGLRRAWSEGWTAGSSERQKQSSGMFIARPTERPAMPSAEPVAAHG